MRQCAAMLVPDSGESLRLVLKQLQENDNRTLEELLEDFLNNPKRGVHIAVVCGWETPWTAEELADHIRRTTNKNVIPYNRESPPVGVVAACICAAVEAKYSVQAERLLQYFFESIKDVIKSVKDYTKPEKGDDEDVKAACEKIANVEQMLGTIASVPSLMVTETLPKEIQTYLSSNEVMNGFPTVKLLVFMPEAAFAEFDKKEYYFFRQIECVLCFPALTRDDLLEMIEGLCRERDEKDAKIERLQEELRRREQAAKEAEKHNIITMIVGSSLLQDQDYTVLYVISNDICLEELNEKDKMLSPLIAQVCSFLLKGRDKDRDENEMPAEVKNVQISGEEIDAVLKRISEKEQIKTAMKKRQILRITDSIYELRTDEFDNGKPGERIIGREGEREF